MSRAKSAIVFLFDVDNTVLDNDRVIADLQSHLESTVGTDCARHYWPIFEDLRTEVGYADYLGALQRYRIKYPRDPAVLAVGRFLLDYPFADRLFPHALKVIEHVGKWGSAAILNDGDVVFQPRKIDRSGLFQAVSGKVMIYLHKEKELDDVARQVPAEHYVLVEDKLRILAAVKNSWGPRVTTVFVRQGHYAHDPKVVAEFPAADVNIESIGDLLQYDLEQLSKHRVLNRQPSPLR